MFNFSLVVSHHCWELSNYTFFDNLEMQCCLAIIWMIFHESLLVLLNFIIFFPLYEIEIDEFLYLQTFSRPQSMSEIGRQTCDLLRAITVHLYLSLKWSWNIVFFSIWNWINANACQKNEYDMRFLLSTSWFNKTSSINFSRIWNDSITRTNLLQIHCFSDRVNEKWKPDQKFHKLFPTFPAP